VLFSNDIQCKELNIIRVVKQRDLSSARRLARFTGEKQNPEKGQKKEERDVRTKSNGSRGRVKVTVLLSRWHQESSIDPTKSTKKRIR